jgi:carboxyl-terminal processing protease
LKVQKNGVEGRDLTDSKDSETINFDAQTKPVKENSKDDKTKTFAELEKETRESAKNLWMNIWFHE